ncbi:hypothetical protein SynBIOSU31_02683 [Synechococcus sp. BIOS-U3-1]|uniref:DUF3104 domain-containing protein n=1 Tax=Synechococcus sp. BIOS-U3-1 TaxID=1400865 RepID=UPI0016441216|nr:DUF3104 domain-containing protein [Synechococcus sp. BIOS-U3-1]QNI59545.1 hypothetical protein SynBIOSU31_02683 [Synechococcus sp. BIOS-U3-1]|tara:strand:- start:1306 stop:1584 length:279 start_codon:yes stop_codon:yes gene_type:complete
MPLHNDHPPFVGVKAGDLVLVQSTLNPDPTDTDWWIGLIISNQGRLKENRSDTVLTVVDTDSGEVRQVNAEQTTRLSLAGMEHNKVVPLIKG